MRISDWSSDVCSSDLEHAAHPFLRERVLVARLRGGKDVEAGDALVLDQRLTQPGLAVDDVDEVVDDEALADRKSVVQGKSVSVRLVLGGCRFINKKHSINTAIK